MKTIDPKDRKLLAKVRALFTSPMAGEAASARNQAATILEKYGLGFDDLDAAPAELAESSKSSGPGFAGLDEWLRRTDPESYARRQEEKTEKRRKEAALRAAAIAKYGSLKAAINALTHREQAIEDAAATFKEWHRSRKATGEEVEYYHLDGFTGGDDHDSITDRARRAVEGAIPLPTTIAEALAEYNAWSDRDEELRVLSGAEFRGYNLSAACRVREIIVYELMMKGLRAASVADASVRVRWAFENDATYGEVQQAILADLDRLAAMEAASYSTISASPVKNGQTETATASPISTVRFGHRESPSDRRAKVILILSNFHTAHLSDLEIAREVGCTRQTVWNIRRRMAAEQAASAGQEAA